MRLPCLLHVCSDVPVLRGINRPQTVPRLGGLRVSCQNVSVKMLVECENRTPEQRTLNPRVRSRWPSALSRKLRGLAAAARATQRAGQRRSRLRYQGQRPSPFPMFRAPGKNQTRAASSLGTMQNIRRPGHAKKPSAGTSELHAWAAASARIRHGRPCATRSGAPATAAPARGTATACGAATIPAPRPEGPHDASRPGPPVPANSRISIHPPRRHPWQQIGTQAPDLRH